MKTRIISAILLIAICLPPLLVGGILLKVLLSVAGLIACYEMSSVEHQKLDLLYFIPMALFLMLFTFVPAYQTSYILFYMVYLFALTIISEKRDLLFAGIAFMTSVLMGYTLNSIYRVYDISKIMVFYVLFATYFTDAFAYFAGMAFGKHKMIPRVSPKKTWEGAAGGWFCGALSSFLWAYFNHWFGLDPILFVSSSLLLPVVSQIGDLAFSLIKRHYGLKDYGNLIPGHGGVLDRVDSLTFTFVTFEAVILLFI